MGAFPDMIQAVLNPVAVQNLAGATDGGRYPVKQMHHVTLAFKPKEDGYRKVVMADPENPVQDGEQVKIKLGNHVFDDEFGVEAVTAKVVRDNGDEVVSLNANPHITVSHTEERKPVDSNKLLDRNAAHKFEDIPLELDATIKFVYYGRK